MNRHIVSLTKIVGLTMIIGIASTNLALAQYYNTQRYGNTTYTNGSNGYSGTSQTYGNQTYYHDNRGTNCTTQRYGNQVYTNCY